MPEEDPIAINKRLKEQQMKADLEEPSDEAINHQATPETAPPTYHSTGLNAEGGDFDASRPGAGEEADRLRDHHPGAHLEAHDGAADKNDREVQGHQIGGSKKSHKLHIKNPFRRHHS